MKKGTRTVVGILLILLVAFTFTNCSPNNAPIPNSSLTLKFAPDAESRTLKPDALSLDVTSYDVSGTGPSGATFSVIGITSTSYVLENLVPGDWSVLAKGYNIDGDLIVQSAQTAISLNSENTTLELDLLPLSGSGTFSLDLSWPIDTIDTAEIIATLTPDVGEVIPLTFVITGTTATIVDLTLPRGYYELSLKLYDTSFNGYLVWSKVETVLIFADEITSKTWTLVAETMNSPTPENLGLVLTVDTKSPIEMSLAGVVALLDFDTTMTVTASGTPVPTSWKWFLDGDVLINETTSSVTVGLGLLENTLHTLTVIGRTGDIAGSTDATFRIGEAPNIIAAVNLLTAGSYVILAQTAISANAGTTVVGDVGASPVTAAAITGFGLTLDPLGTFSTSLLVTGSVYASDYSDPTPANLTQAVLDANAAYAEAESRVEQSGISDLIGEIGGMTLAPGLYSWGSAVSISSNLTLHGPSTGVWIFQIDGSLTQAAAISVLLTGGALAEHVFWQVGGGVGLGADAHIEGIVLSGTGIALGAGASANGRLLAKTAITLDQSDVTQPLN